MSSRVERVKDKGLEAVSEVLAGIGIEPDHLNSTGVVFAGFAALCYVSGNPTVTRFAFPLYLGSAGCDALDGSLARYIGVASVDGAGKDHIADRISDSLLAVAVVWRGIDEHEIALVLAGGILATSFIPAMIKQLALRAGVSPERLPKLAIGSRPVRVILTAVALSLSMLGGKTDVRQAQSMLFAAAGMLGIITGLTRLKAALRETGGTRAFLKVLSKPREAASTLQPGEIRDSHKKIAISVAILIPLISCFFKLLRK